MNFFIRFFTGFIYIFLILFSIEKGEKYFRILMMILSFFCLYEFLVISKTKSFFIKIISLFFLLSIFFDFFMEMKEETLPYVISFIFSPIFFLGIQIFYQKTLPKKENIMQISNLIFGLVYIVLPFFLTFYIYKTVNSGKNLILGIFILIWIHDTLSYLIGKKFGKRKIASFISPEKSLEGFFGGLFFCLIFGIFLYKIWDKKYWCFFSFIIPIFSTIGDLVESYIKRSYDVKNSGSGIWFPGHGGFLDRLDSLIFVIPIMFIIILIYSL
ncbi:phosphatidate cytidylyltransferase [Blattabacterium cuenoti]|uniref:phosphatidate cytidylyltransferase n=1 Tax=Blattabacterium cuenoti TaxID=1653831 RepID=UPI00163C1CA7|nr:phosphatidate cytidylyltransferase [Blattabacterium cuenoti]